MFGDVKTCSLLMSGRVGIQSRCGPLYPKVHYSRKAGREGRRRKNGNRGRKKKEDREEGENNSGNLN